MRPAKRDINPDADSHAGRHGDFTIRWDNERTAIGWFVVFDSGDYVGPFHTSQAAFGAVKDAIDELIK